MFTAKTSETHPLQIQSVTPPGTSGRIGMTFCPGKKQPDAMTGPWDRDLNLDLRAIVEWGGQVLVSLIEDHEFAMLGVEALPEYSRRHRIDWVHLPIQDGGIPTEHFEARWETTGGALRHRITAGESIVLHCKGGLGRTGMIAARLLVEMGVGPATAITQVRAARRGAVETDEQERHVYRFNSLPDQRRTEVQAP
jgi:ADP-ribosyl-[dinitrogen reductase] hydrolase